MVRYEKILLTSLLALNSVLLSADTLYIPKVGYQVWYDTHIGAPVKTVYVLASANLHRVATRKGMDFYPDMHAKNDMRLNFSYPTKEQIVQGLKRLAQTIQENM